MKLRLIEWVPHYHVCHIFFRLPSSCPGRFLAPPASSSLLPRHYTQHGCFWLVTTGEGKKIASDLLSHGAGAFLHTFVTPFDRHHACRARNRYIITIRRRVYTYLEAAGDTHAHTHTRWVIGLAIILLLLTLLFSPRLSARELHGQIDFFFFIFSLVVLGPLCGRWIGLRLRTENIMIITT